MAKDKRIALVVDEATKLVIEDRASVRGKNASEFCVEAALFYGGLDRAFVDEIQKTAREMGVKTNVLLQNLIIDRIAMADAFQAVFGRSSRSLAGAFEMRDGQIMTGDALSKKRTTEYKKIFRKWKKNLVDARTTGDTFRVSDAAVEVMAAQV